MEMNAFRANHFPPPSSEISVHIETLVVHGFGVSNPDHLGVVVQQHLESLLREQGLPILSRSQGIAAVQVPAVRAPAIRATRHMASASAGEKIAQAIQGGLNR